MARFKLEDGAIVDTDRAAQSWAFTEPTEAAKWLLLNEHELPEDLAALAGDLIE